MSTPSGLNARSTADSSTSSRTGSQVWRDRIAPSLLAFALGVALIYGAGFASRVELHNAAHDGRHSAGFPCH
ncbi:MULTISPECIES: CbtB domain-containing protein [unclassified Herbaspirillum]|uniref:CbtB domain-containing protein n=1 Tax=unclassified Herbaspirillum TaxID=2624150 RepID=UPI001585ADC4|nr:MULTISPECIES: CbtB domain-containing protein [unclassified Herbaspirillum]MCI1005874.1 CbtB-domain containing protein [Herbaspirillum sp. C7C8]NUT61826.1 CbtB-domain containing protein [Herbaspirillum sp. C9C3]